INTGSGSQKESPAVTDLDLTLCVGTYVPAQPVKLVLGALSLSNGSRNRPADLRLVGFGQWRTSHDLLAIHPSVAELKPHPLRQISHTRTHAPCRCFGIGFAHKAVLVNAIFKYVQRRLVGVVFVVGKSRTCGAHADFRIEAFVGNILPSLAGLFCGGNRSFRHSEITVVIGGAELTRKRHK